MQGAGGAPPPAAGGTEAPGTATTGDAPANEDATGYVLLEAPAWDLDEAIDYRAGLGPLAETEPELDWYAQCLREPIDNPDGSFTVQSVNISGHTVSLEGRRARLEGFGFEFDAGDVEGRRAAVAPAANRNPALVVVEVRPDYSITILSYDEVDLGGLAARLVSVDEKAVGGRRGQMLDCDPFEPGCASDG